MHNTRFEMTRRAARLACIVASVALSAACVGYATVDGWDAAYVSAPPPGIYGYPRYPFHDGYVYDVGGHYYHQHNGRWVAYRSRPPGVPNYARR
jgi:hypothetical protein